MDEEKGLKWFEKRKKKV